MEAIKWLIKPLEGMIDLFNMGPMELLIILLIALLLFGPSRLPDVAKSLGKSIGSFKRALKEDAEEDGKSDPSDKEEKN